MPATPLAFLMLIALHACSADTVAPAHGSPDSAATQRPVPLLALLAVAYLPILDRPKRSLPLGVAIAAGTALVIAVWARAIG